MPAVFSPGEPETRPLDPTAIVYTTAQKVADLLDIGPAEAVAVSANSETGAVFVTGADYRSIGFSVDDKILIYSDADPLGQTATISSITSSASGVKLNFTDITLTAADFETADNTYVQNKASFTNGRTRGMTKAKVENLILKMQDRIDNITHNAWRPYLVSAEYINFDTYKPYRRRYYTDYVGTAPLLFRNVQQILRLELWQGSDYREIGAAEARIKFNDVSDLASSGIYISPGNGSVAIIEQGTATNQWRDDFDAGTVAQNLADLINKEDRVGKTIVEFNPAFTLEGLSSNVGLHNEFFATANADYGTGVVKVTSMRPVKGGETCTIVATNSDITIEQTSKTSTAVTGGVVTSTITTAGSGYSAGTFGTTGGSGSGLEVTVTVAGGAISAVSAIATAGSDYKKGDVVTIDSGNEDATLTISSINAVDGTTITATDTGSFVHAGVVLIGSEVFSYTGKTNTSFTGCTNVEGTPLTTLATYTGSDSFEQHKFTVDLQGGSSSGDNARLRDWWMDHEMGIIYFNNSYPFFEWNAVKTAYIYGERYVEKAIEDVCTKMVAIDLLLSDDRSVLIPEGTQNIDLASKVQLYQAEIDKTLPKYIEMVLFE